MNETPLYLFIFLMLVMFYFILQALNDTNMRALFSCFISVILAFTLAKVSINEQLVQNFGDISSTDSIIFGTSTVVHSAQAWIFTAIAIFMSVRLIMILVENYKNIYGEVAE